MHTPEPWYVVAGNLYGPAGKGRQIALTGTASGDLCPQGVVDMERAALCVNVLRGIDDAALAAIEAGLRELPPEAATYGSDDHLTRLFWALADRLGVHVVVGLDESDIAERLEDLGRPVDREAIAEACLDVRQRDWSNESAEAAEAVLAVLDHS